MTPLPLFDSHCHLDDPAFAAELNGVIARARQAGVRRLMSVGTTLETSMKALELARREEGVFAAVGVHPHDANACTEEVIERLIDLARDPRVRAWGETGLDFNRMHSPRDEQERWFVRQLEAAAETGLPAIFHERDSDGRFLELLEAGPLPASAVVHCFSGNRGELRRYLDLGFCIGITGIVTLKERGEPLRGLLAYIPADRILVETDAPYLTPEPHRRRHRRNEPAFVPAVLQRVAEVRGEDPEELAQTVFANTCRLYGIGWEAGKLGG